MGTRLFVTLLGLLALGAPSASAQTSLSVRASSPGVVLTRPVTVTVSGSATQPSPNYYPPNISVTVEPSPGCVRGAGYFWNTLRWEIRLPAGFSGPFSNPHALTLPWPCDYVVRADLLIQAFYADEQDVTASASTPVTVSRPHGTLATVTGSVGVRGHMPYLRVRAQGTSDVAAHLLATALTGSGDCNSRPWSRIALRLPPQPPYLPLRYFPDPAPTWPSGVNSDQITTVGPGRFDTTFAGVIATDRLSTFFYGRRVYRICVWLGRAGERDVNDAQVSPFELARWSKVLTLVVKPKPPAVLSIKRRRDNVHVVLRACRNDRYELYATYQASGRQFWGEIVVYDGYGKIAGQFSPRFNRATGTVRFPRCTFKFALSGHF